MFLSSKQSLPVWVLLQTCSCVSLLWFPLIFVAWFATCSVAEVGPWLSGVVGVSGANMQWGSGINSSMKSRGKKQNVLTRVSRLSPASTSIDHRLGIPFSYNTCNKECRWTYLHLWIQCLRQLDKDPSLPNMALLLEYLKYCKGSLNWLDVWLVCWLLFGRLIDWLID